MLIDSLPVVPTVCSLRRRFPYSRQNYFDPNGETYEWGGAKEKFNVVALDLMRTGTLLVVALLLATANDTYGLKPWMVGGALIMNEIVALGIAHCERRFMEFARAQTTRAKDSGDY